MRIYKKNLDINPYSRCGVKLLTPPRIGAVHWVAKPGQRALDVIRFWQDRQLGFTDYGGGHYIVDLDGTIYNTIPPDEKAYHVGSKQGYTSFIIKKLGPFGPLWPNDMSMGIEMCHIDWEGRYSDKTFDSAVELFAYYCNVYEWDPYGDVITHKYVVGWKDCPLWFTKHPEDFDGFRTKIKNRMATIDMADIEIIDLNL